MASRSTFHPNTLSNVLQLMQVLKEKQTTPETKLAVKFADYSMSTSKLTAGRVTLRKDGTPISLGELLGNDVWKKMRPDIFINDLNPYQRALSLTIESTLRQYGNNLQKALEIGSGGNPIINFLPTYEAKEKNRVVLSDYSQECVALLKKEHPASSSHVVDVLEMSKKFSGNSFQCVVMKDVLSVMCKGIMKQALGEIFQILAPGGVMIHFAPRNAFMTILIDQYVSNDLIIFPALDNDQNYGEIYTVEKQEFEEVLARLSPTLPQELVSSFKRYIHLTPAEREDFCEKLRYEEKDTLRFFSKSFEKLGCKTAKRLNANETFDLVAKELLEKTGFKICKFVKVSSQCIGPGVRGVHEHEDMHQFEIDRGLERDKFLGMLAPGHVQEVVTMHLIVAKKI